MRYAVMANSLFAAIDCAVPVRWYFSEDIPDAGRSGNLLMGPR
jgi:hypothetical protein